MRCPPITPGRCAAAALARPGDPTVSRVLRWAPVSIGRQGGQIESTNSIFCYFIPCAKVQNKSKCVFFHLKYNKPLFFLPVVLSGLQ